MCGVDMKMLTWTQDYHITSGMLHFLALTQDQSGHTNTLLSLSNNIKSSTKLM